MFSFLYCEFGDEFFLRGGSCNARGREFPFSKTRAFVKVILASTKDLVDVMRIVSLVASIPTHLESLDLDFPTESYEFLCEKSDAGPFWAA